MITAESQTNDIKKKQIYEEMVSFPMCSNRENLGINLQFFCNSINFKGNNINVYSF